MMDRPFLIVAGIVAISAATIVVPKYRTVKITGQDHQGRAVAQAFS